jgi:hypothetical protein
VGGFGDGGKGGRNFRAAGSARLVQEDKMGPYPLFDTGFMFWRGDLDSMLSHRLGTSLKELGVHERELQAHYHAGLSAARMADDLSLRVPMAAE